jgi:diadenosine tetraphosphatase ApaH/serine/threonine PP2A family protein phosphatase
VDLVAELPNLTCLAGNHDWAALKKLNLGDFNPEARRAAEWTAKVLRQDVHSFLKELSPKLELEGFALAHASPRDPIWEYMVVEEQGPPNFAEFEEPFCLVGHTHVPRVFVEIEGNATESKVARPMVGDEIDLRDGSRRIVNTGSVGQPRDRDPRAAYGTWDSETGIFRFHRTAYDVHAAQQKIVEAGLPGVLATRLALGL